MTRIDDQMDAIVGGLLAGGVITSLTLIIAGLIWHRLVTGVATFDAPLGGTDALQLLAGDLRLAVAGRLSPRLLVSLGIAVLLFTPYLRVLASVVFFAAVEHDWKYTTFTGFVLAVLTYSLVTR
jgi:uncharacterized membrane protein